MKRHVFIITYGRTGSTLLQGILNCSENVLILGENFNYIYHLFMAYSSLELLEEHADLLGFKKKFRNALRKGVGIYSPRDKPMSPFFGASGVNLNRRQAKLLKSVRSYFHKHPLATKAQVIGLKEIRYDLENFSEYLDFLQRALDPIQFVFLTRDPDQVARSGFHKLGDRSETLAMIARTERRFFGYSDRNPDICFHIDYADLTSGAPRIEELFEFLNLPFEKDRVDRVLATPHSYDLQTFRPEAGS